MSCADCRCSEPVNETIEAHFFVARSCVARHALCASKQCARLDGAGGEEGVGSERQRMGVGCAAARFACPASDACRPALRWRWRRRIARAPTPAPARCCGCAPDATVGRRCDAAFPCAQRCAVRCCAAAGSVRWRWWWRCARPTPPSKGACFLLVPTWPGAVVLQADGNRFFDSLPATLLCHALRRPVPSDASRCALCSSDGRVTEARSTDCGASLRSINQSIDQRMNE
jgi:hypothetical protein